MGKAPLEASCPDAKPPKHQGAVATSSQCRIGNPRVGEPCLYRDRINNCLRSQCWRETRGAQEGLSQPQTQCGSSLGMELIHVHCCKKLCGLVFLFFLSLSVFSFS